MHEIKNKFIATSDGEQKLVREKQQFECLMFV